MNKNDPAFPCIITVSRETTCEAEAIEAGSYDGKIYDQVPCSGLTKREWFAGMAMQGMLSSNEFAGTSPHDIKKYAYEQADAMLEEGG